MVATKGLNEIIFPINAEFKFKSLKLPVLALIPIGAGSGKNVKEFSVSVIEVKTPGGREIPGLISNEPFNAASAELADAKVVAATTGIAANTATAPLKRLDLQVII
ncbi:hypothetical protein [Nostoc sp. CCY0012]|uniref:hypothetical protein n=1 Tax=Nostoc sp. CCY0012 TaxID=1056123 RepID=UPI0039C641EB